MYKQNWCVTGLHRSLHAPIFVYRLFSYFLLKLKITVKVSKVSINSFSNAAICAASSFKPSFSFSTSSTIPPNQAACLGMMMKRRSPLLLFSCYNNRLIKACLFWHLPLHFLTSISSKNRGEFFSTDGSVFTFKFTCLKGLLILDDILPR